MSTAASASQGRQRSRARGEWSGPESASANSGGAGKQLVAGGAVRVDGAVESRKTAKIRAGQSVRVGDVEIRVRAAD